MDTHSVFEDPILSLSLGSSCTMDFKKDEQKIAIDLPSRSLLIMSGESRYAWSHGICPRHNDNIQMDTGLSTRPRDTRVSFTFRKVRNGPCNCQYVDYCDTKRNIPNVKEIDNSIASNLENLYVHDVSVTFNRFFIINFLIVNIFNEGLRRNFKSFQRN